MPSHSRGAKVQHHEQVGVGDHPAPLASHGEVNFIQNFWKINNSGPIKEIQN